MITQSGVKLYVGLASYKIGDAQQGGAEWAGSTDMMARQVDYARTLSRYGGFALYRYDSLFNPASGVSGAGAVLSGSRAVRSSTRQRMAAA